MSLVVFISSSKKCYIINRGSNLGRGRRTEAEGGVPEGLVGTDLPHECADLFRQLEKQWVLQDMSRKRNKKEYAFHIRLPTVCVSPNRPSGASAFKRPLRIFSSLGNGGKNRGGGGWPGSERSGMFGGAEVNALRLCA